MVAANTVNIKYKKLKLIKSCPKTTIIAFIKKYIKHNDLEYLGNSVHWMQDEGVKLVIPKFKLKESKINKIIREADFIALMLQEHEVGRGISIEVIRKQKNVRKNRTF